MFRYVPLSHILHYNSAITIFLCRLPLGESTAIFFSSPAITMILSFFLLKYEHLFWLSSSSPRPYPTPRRDHCGVWRIAVAALGITGVVVVARPPGLFPPEVIIIILMSIINIFNIINSINITILLSYPIQSLEYQTDEQRCRFDKPISVLYQRRA